MHPRRAIECGFLAVLAYAASGCSNVPPNAYALGRSDGAQFAVSARSAIPHDGFVTTYRDPVPRVRETDGLEGHPEWGQAFDMFTLSVGRRTGLLHYGGFVSNLYPGILLGIKGEYLGADAFVSASLPGLKILPGLQFNSSIKRARFSYSLFRQNLGSIIGLPYGAEPGPYRVVWADKALAGIKVFGDRMLLSAYLERAYWKGIRTVGIEISASNP